MYEIRAAGRTAEVWIYEDIGESFFGEGVTAKRIAADLRAAGNLNQLNVRINSQGGDATEGFAIFNLLRRQKARVDTFIDAAALSAASVVAMAGETIEAAENALIMIHEPYTRIGGDADALRRMADVLDKVGDQIAGTYAARGNEDAGEFRELMKAETWLTASEAQSLGLVDSIAGALDIAAKFDPGRFRHPPRWALERAPVAPDRRDRLAAMAARLCRSQASRIAG